MIESALPPAVLSIDLNALHHNINFFKKKINAKLMVVVKANAYGHDALMISTFLERNQLVDYLAVAYVWEGIAIREAGVRLPIMVLHPQKQNLRQCIDYQLEPTIYEIDLLKQWSTILQEIVPKPITHLEFNTGLNRLGFETEQVNQVLKIVKDHSLQIRSVFSHLAASECMESIHFTKKQIEKFNIIRNTFIASMPITPMFHMSNTSGILNYPQAHFDMVRLGLGIYGFANEDQYTAHLKLVATLKVTISQIRTIPKGYPISYNRTFYTKKEMRIATLPIGHADGISRQHRNESYVYLKGKPCLIVGDVCMDMIMIDVSNIDCKEGDEVVIFENQQQLESLATQRATIPYEVLVNIGKRVARIAKE